METQSPYKIDRLTTLAQLDALEMDWSELLDEIPGLPIFLTWEWIRTWWVYFGQGRQMWLLTARDEQGRLLGIAPFMSEKYHKGLMKLDTITFIGTGRVCPTHLNILARASDKKELYRAFLDFLFLHSDQWDVLRIQSVAPDSIEHNLLKTAGGHIRIGAETPSLYIPLAVNWDAYLNTTSQRFRRNLKTASSKLEGDYPGKVNFACVTNPQKLNSVMEKLEELIRDRCHTKKLPTDWDDLTFANFHRTIASLALNRGWLRLYTLTVDDHTVALVYNFCFKDCFYGYNMGYDNDWSKYNPGRLIVAYSIQMAIQEAAVEFDMGRGDADHKFSWTNHVRTEDEILFSSNWKGSLWIKFGNIERGLKIKAMQLFARVAKLRMEQFPITRRKKIESQSG